MEVILTEQDDYTATQRKAFEKWGLDFNLDMVIEEAAEVIQAINKWKRFKDEKAWEHMHEEFADLQICMDVLYSNFLSNNDLKVWYRAKMKRMEEERL